MELYLRYRDRQRTGWAELTAEERVMVRDPFPIIYQATNYEPGKFKYIPSDFKGENGHSGPLKLGDDITTIFVPREKVAFVEAYLAKKGVSNVSVHSLEAMATSRLVFSGSGVRYQGNGFEPYHEMSPQRIPKWMGRPPIDTQKK